jgi:hypothetical protein
MAQLCTVCSHPDAVLINEDIVGIGERGKPSNRRIAAHYNLSEQAIRRHAEHIPKLLLQASRANEILEADKFLDRVLEHLDRGRGLEERAGDGGDIKTEIDAHGSVRGDLRLLGEAIGKIVSAATVNLILMNPTWMKLEQVVVDSLEPYPEARASVLRALEAAERGELDAPE